MTLDVLCRSASALGMVTSSSAQAPPAPELEIEGHPAAGGGDNPPSKDAEAEMRLEAAASNKDGGKDGEKCAESGKSTPKGEYY